MPGSALAEKKFTSGVTAGEVTAHSAIIWARAAREGPVRAQGATGGAFQHVVVARALRASDSNNDTVQTTIGGLNADQTYHYRFCLPGGTRCSPKGKFLTAPLPSAGKTIRFAWSGDETGVKAPGQENPFWGNFKAFRTMVGEHNDFNIDFGDTIYSHPEVPNQTAALQVGQKWAMYR